MKPEDFHGLGQESGARLRSIDCGLSSPANKMRRPSSCPVPLLPGRASGFFSATKVTKAFKLPFVAELAMGSSLVDRIDLPEYPSNELKPETRWFRSARLSATGSGNSPRTFCIYVGKASPLEKAAGLPDRFEGPLRNGRKKCRSIRELQEATAPRRLKFENRSSAARRHSRALLSAIPSP